MEYNKFIYFLFKGDKSSKDLSEMFNINIDSVNEVSTNLFLLESCKLNGRFGQRLQPVSTENIKTLFNGLVKKNIMSIDELSIELGVSKSYIRQLCNQAV